MVKKQTGEAAAERKGLVSIITLKGTEEFRDWLSAQSKRTHIPVTTIMRLGLAAWAKENGAQAPPEK